MQYYETFLRMGCFTYDDVVKLVGSKATANTLLQDNIKRQKVRSVKRGLYVALGILDKEPVVNKYVIASNLTDTSAVSHHSAFEYYGYANQVSYFVTVVSESKMNDFDFNGFHYHRLQPCVNGCGIQKQDGIRVTDIERTVLDSINEFEKDMGFEELIKCIAAIPVLNQGKLLDYLALYDKQFLYQKTGFILEHFKREFDISDIFLNECREKSGKSSRYLLRETSGYEPVFSNKWHLTVPKNIWASVTGGGDEDADV